MREERKQRKAAESGQSEKMSGIARSLCAGEEPEKHEGAQDGFFVDMPPEDKGAERSMG